MQVRGQKVILDFDLAELYEVETKVLNRAFKRNADRFPADFMFQLTGVEYDGLRCHFGTSNAASGTAARGRGGRRYLPHAFTQGRRSVRLPAYDYSSDGAYFITICTQNRLCLFGDVVAGEMVLNERGRIADDEFTKTGELRSNVIIDTYVIMPNHVHMIIVITGDDKRRDMAQCGDMAHCRDMARHVPTGKRTFGKPQPGSLSVIVGAIKSSITKNMNLKCGFSGGHIWQGRFYEHIIRNDNSYETIRQYVLENPLHWGTDDENPLRMGRGH